MIIEERIPTVEEYKRIRESVGWWDTDVDATVVGLKSSLYSVVALEKNVAVGCGRICGDGGLYFYIQDLMIHPDYQHQGLGKKIMKVLMDYLFAHTKPGAYIALMAAKGMENYYAEFGFKSRPKYAPGMYQIF